MVNSKWFLPPASTQTDQAECRLFCFPFAGGGASVFRSWPQQLGPQIEVWPVQLPGRENRLKEPPFNRLADLIPVVAQAVLPLLEDKPFAFFGHSMGGLIAFELARYLAAHFDQQPSQLIISACREPVRINRDPSIHNLPEAQFIAQMQKRYGGIPPVLAQNAELMRFFIPLLRADLALVETYQWAAKPLLNCPISVFGGNADRVANGDDLEGWRSQTSTNFSLTMLDGGHFFMRQAQTQAELLGSITNTLLAQLVR